MMTFADHKVATAIGAVGVAMVLGHVVLGREVVPPLIALLGAGIAAAAGIVVALVGRRGRTGGPPGASTDGSSDGSRTGTR